MNQKWTKDYVVTLSTPQERELSTYIVLFMQLIVKRITVGYVQVHR